MNSIFGHAAVLVPSVDTSAAYLRTLGIKTGKPDTFDSEGTKEIYVGSYDDQEGLLLLVEAIGPGPYQRALQKRGPSLHHLAMDVLDLKGFVARAERAGWKQHAISNDKCVWLYVKGLPLLEVHHRQSLSMNPSKITRIDMSLNSEWAPLFEAVGLGEFVKCGKPALTFNVDGHDVSFTQLVQK